MEARVAELLQIIQDSTSSPGSVKSAADELRTITKEKLGELGNGIRPVIRGLITAAEHLPDDWAAIVDVLSFIAHEPSVSWMLRAFLVKSLGELLMPDWIQRAEDAGKRYVEPVCAILIAVAAMTRSVTRAKEPSSTNEATPADEGSDPSGSIATQAQKIALSSLMSLVSSHGVCVARMAVAHLPSTCDVCVALIGSSMAKQEMWDIFEEWLFAHPEAALTAGTEMHTASIQIQQHLAKFNKLHDQAQCAQACKSILALGIPESKEQMASLTVQLKQVTTLKNSRGTGAKIPFSHILHLAQAGWGFLPECPPATVQSAVESGGCDDAMEFLRAVVDVAGHSAAGDSHMLTKELIQSTFAPIVSISSPEAARSIPIVRTEALVQLLARVVRDRYFCIRRKRAAAADGAIASGKATATDNEAAPEEAGPSDDADATIQEATDALTAIVGTNIPILQSVVADAHCRADSAMFILRKREREEQRDLKRRRLEQQASDAAKKAAEEAEAPAAADGDAQEPSSGDKNEEEHSDPTGAVVSSDGAAEGLVKSAENKPAPILAKQLCVLKALESVCATLIKADAYKVTISSSWKPAPPVAADEHGKKVGKRGSGRSKRGGADSAPHGRGRGSGAHSSFGDAGRGGRSRGSWGGGSGGYRGRGGYRDDRNGESSGYGSRGGRGDSRYRRN